MCEPDKNLYSAVEMASNTTDVILSTNYTLDGQMNLCRTFHNSFRIISL